jgi:flagellar biosynthetic protein FliO
MPRDQVRALLFSPLPELRPPGFTPDQLAGLRSMPPFCAELKLTFGLVLVVGIIFGLAWLMKKMQWTQHSQKGLIQIISAVSVSHRDRIALIQVGDEQILVGMSPGRMQTLHTLKSPIEVSPTSKGDEEQKGFAHHFQQNLKQVIKREGNQD